MKTVTVVSDGSAIPNPGKGALGCFVAETDAAGVLRRVWLVHRLLEGQWTNNEAEYQAAVLGLELACERCPEGVLTLVVDSELLVKQVYGEYRTAMKFRPWRDAIIATGCAVKWHARESVTGRIADLLSRGEMAAARVAVDEWARQHNEQAQSASRVEVEYIAQEDVDVHGRRGALSGGAGVPEGAGLGGGLLSRTISDRGSA